MLSGTLYFDQRVIAHMEGRSERKWKTLRDISSSQEESESVSLERTEESLPEQDLETPSSSDSETTSVSPSEEGPLRVLVAHPSTSTSRLLRETLENFTEARVETTSDPIRAFELALQKSHRIYFFAMEIGELNGPLLYELISKAFSTGHGPKQLAPGVVYIRESKEEKIPDGLRRDARVKDIISKPIRIDRLLQSVGGVLDVHDPTANV